MCQDKFEATPMVSKPLGSDLLKVLNQASDEILSFMCIPQAIMADKPERKPKKREQSGKNKKPKKPKQTGRLVPKFFDNVVVK